MHELEVSDATGIRVLKAFTGLQGFIKSVPQGDEISFQLVFNLRKCFINVLADAEAQSSSRVSKTGKLMKSPIILVVTVD